jgi:hypothetical protein
VTKELAESFGLSKAQGAVVNAVEKGGPAEKAGIEPGDVILKFDGKPISSSSDLPRIVGSTKPGSKVTMQVWRKGATRELTLVVGEIAEEKVASAQQRRSTKPAERAANRLGLVVSELTAEQKRELKVNGGLLIEDVRNNAARVDLRPGDVILALISRGREYEIKSANSSTAARAARQVGQRDPAGAPRRVADLRHHQGSARSAAASEPGDEADAGFASLLSSLQEMEGARALAAEFGVEVEVLDVDADAALEARYDELVPVLLHAGTSFAITSSRCSKVRDYLSEIR